MDVNSLLDRFAIAFLVTGGIVAPLLIFQFSYENEHHHEYRENPRFKFLLIYIALFLLCLLLTGSLISFVAFLLEAGTEKIRLTDMIYIFILIAVPIAIILLWRKLIRRKTNKPSTDTQDFPIVQAENDKPTEIWICPKCQQVNEKKRAFCLKCGTQQ